MGEPGIDSLEQGKPIVSCYRPSTKARPITPSDLRQRCAELAPSMQRLTRVSKASHTISELSQLLKNCSASLSCPLPPSAAARLPRWPRGRNVKAEQALRSASPPMRGVRKASSLAKLRTCAALGIRYRPGAEAPGEVSASCTANDTES